MSTYPREIEGKYPLDQINLQIAYEEAGASRFVQSTITDHDTNKVDFEELPPGTILKPLTVVKQGSAQPDGTTEVWSGLMLVENQRQNVVAYREV
jgi:hypothetical protein